MLFKFGMTMILILHLNAAISQPGQRISPGVLKNLVGCWNGSLTYLDYSNGKPFSMPANMVVKDFGNDPRVIYSLMYPKEPRANSTDTLVISEDGRMLNGKMISEIKNYTKDSIMIVTLENAVDGNDRQPALIRHSYLLGSGNYVMKKEVQFTGKSQWLVRSEYRFVRSVPCPDETK